MENPTPRPLIRGCVNQGRKAGAVQWCPLCYTNIRGRSNAKGHIGYRTRPTPYIPFERYVMKRPESKPAGAIAGIIGQCTDEAFTRKYPTILQYLTDDRYDDGAAREVSVLSVSVRDGMVAVALNDKDLKQSMYTQDDTLAGCLKLLEGALVSNGQWRPWKSGKKR